MTLIERGFTCVNCGEFCSGYVELRHSSDGSVTIVLRCENCAKEPLCSGNTTGIHSEIITADDSQEFDPRYIFPITDRLDDWQMGYCILCKVPFYWNIEGQRWRTMEWANG